MSIKNWVLKNKKDLIIILILLIISIWFFQNTLGFNRLMDNGHYLHEQTFFSYNYKIALEDNTLPFWTSYWFSGQPLYGDSQVFFLNLTFFYILLFKNIFFAITLSSISYFFIAGLGMYFLAKHILNSRPAAFISSLIFMFNGIIYNFIIGGNPSILEPYALMPLVLLSVLKAMKTKNYVPYAIAAGLLIASQIHSGGMIVFIYTMILIPIYFALYAILSFFRIDIKRYIIVFSILYLVFFGFSAIKLLPNMYYTSKSNRAPGLHYEEYVGGDHLVIEDFFKVVVFNQQSPSYSVHIGILAFILVLLSLVYFKKKNIPIFYFISIFAVILASDTFLTRFFYDYVPAFAQTRHIIRVMFLFVLSSSILAGYGFIFLKDKLSKFIKIKYLALILGVIFSLVIMTELIFLKQIPEGFDMKKQVENIPMADHLQKQPKYFRISTFDVNDLISFYGSSYYAHYDLETLSGGGGMWISPYIEYLAVAKQYNFSKIAGIMNLKYMTSTKQVEKPGFKEIAVLENCTECLGWSWWIDGPYLYENEEYLPRYYTTNNAVLVVGNPDQVKALSYNLMISNTFNPKRTVLIQGKYPRISDYDRSLLKRFKGIILLEGSIDDQSLVMLREYKDSGGILLPDIIENKNSLDTIDILNLFNSMEEDFIVADVNQISLNEIAATPKEPGFLILSERFSSFEDWKAKSNEKEYDIFMADNMLSAVYVENPEEISFSYFPKAFKNGLIITSITVLGILIYFSIFIYRKLKKK